MSELLQRLLAQGVSSEEIQEIRKEWSSTWPEALKFHMVLDLSKNEPATELTGELKRISFSRFLSEEAWNEIRSLPFHGPYNDPFAKPIGTSLELEGRILTLAKSIGVEGSGPDAGVDGDRKHKRIEHSLHEIAHGFVLELRTWHGLKRLSEKVTTLYSYGNWSEVQKRNHEFQSLVLEFLLAKWLKLEWLHEDFLIEQSVLQCGGSWVPNKARFRRLQKDKKILGFLREAQIYLKHELREILE